MKFQQMKLLAPIFLAVGFCSSAQASFELVLMVDLNNHCIQRYDGESGVYLGNFGANRLSNSMFAMALDQGRNRVYVSDVNAVRAFNYNTGEYIASITSTASNLGVFSNGDILVSNGTNCKRIDFATGNVVTTYDVTAGGFNGNVVACTVDENDNVFVADGTANLSTNSCFIDRFSPSGTYIASSANYAQRFTGYAQQMRAKGGQIIIGDGAASRVNYFNYTSGAPVLQPNTVINGNVTVFGVALGHSDIRYVAGTDGTNSRLLALYSNGSTQQVIATPQISASSVRQIAVVVAPEPGPMIGLGLGMFLVLRRKNS
ncbi:MAG: PEP-CTERM sorting domain-containing protein [Armatimonadetes bacterium]|nr:PEP-CTERM sorting domain-containing protein [Armatimonadota bacterium]